LRSKWRADRADDHLFAEFEAAEYERGATVGAAGLDGTADWRTIAEDQYAPVSLALLNTSARVTETACLEARN
jgi:hypothetical protein